ncbi:ATP-binding cassette domain-containing protein [Tateyamaria omphalii]|uniref:iron ABC transporter ATP-binding protein n=1 Tax=Tateyamaria omphalii TaxID=299262 RepID=UPI001C99D92F|nr:ATP-binding cassette domain-containing protein [Tateyamaria omphalii]MBY5934960.1 ATP-binding cassette domain-containing protein [Tateyamaria omphalii]
MISIRNVTYDIAGKPVLCDVSLDLPRHGVTALIGPNGAGKSTLLSLVARLMPLQSGGIDIDGQDITTCDTGALARVLSILPQIQDAAPRLTVSDLVAFGRYPHSRGRLTAEDHRIVDNSLDAFRLSDMRNRALETLSGGQRQNALLAMIFAQGTDYLLLDEPLNNLDIAAARGLMTQLRTLADEQQRSIVIVLHDINYALAYADHLVVMTEGRVAATGSPKEVISQDLINRIYRTDAAVIAIGDRRLVDVGP